MQIVSELLTVLAFSWSVLYHKVMAIAAARKKKFFILVKGFVRDAIMSRSS